MNHSHRESNANRAANFTHNTKAQPTDLPRRTFLSTAAIAGVGLAAGLPATLIRSSRAAETISRDAGSFSPGQLDAFTLPELPYQYDALNQVIDTETMTLHHTKHHQAYVNGLNGVVAAHPELQSMSLVEMLTRFKELPESAQTAVRNHGGGHANHSLFWQVMRPARPNNRPEGDLANLIESAFGSFDNFKEKFAENALGQFGSGWSWLVVSDGKLELMKSANQDSPLMEGKRPILGNDVWEHAYYLKYQNRRADYVNAWWDIVNWDQVAINLQA